MSFIKKIPGYRSGKWWKKIIASIFYFFLIITILASIFPSDSQTENNTTEIPTPTPTLEKIKDTVKVERVIDGDTIKLETGETVRYIGIDTPETVHPSKPVQCYGEEASKKNKELVEGKEVRLEKDVSETDKYNRLLRYIWVEDILINEYLVREGYANSSSYPPDIKYQDKFIEAEKLAREEKKGLWGDICNITPTPKPEPTTLIQEVKPTISVENLTNIIKEIQNPSSSTYICDCSKTCSNMTCDEAYFQLNDCGCSKRDGDDDGVPCESICP